MLPKRNMLIIWILMIISFCKVFVPNRNVLQNDMSLAYQIYSQVGSQLQVSRAKVQEEKPVFAVIEPAVVR